MEENGIWGIYEMRIAICDDEKKLRNSLRRVLETQLQLDGVDYEIQEYECGEDPVSYTHLDVYKRQWAGSEGECRPGNRRNGCSECTG